MTSERPEGRRVSPEWFRRPAGERCNDNSNSDFPPRARKGGGAERNRLYRLRQKLDLGVLPIVTDIRATAELMVLRCYLNKRDVENFPAIVDACSRFHADLLRDASLADVRREG